MGDEKGLAVVRQEPRDVGAPIDRYAFEPASWVDAAKMAEALYASRLLPADIQTPQAALAVIVQGRELGLTVMQSLRGIAVIKGKPAPSAQLLVALVKRSSACERLECTEATPQRATWVTRRRGESERSLSWTMEDARQAGLAGSAMYSRFPKNMLKWRAASDLIREVYPDVAGGLYTQEELQDAQEAPQEPRPTPPGPEGPEPAATQPEPSQRPQAAPETKPGRRSFRRVIEDAGGTLDQAKAIAREIWGHDDLARLQRQDLEAIVTRIQESQRMAQELLEEARGNPAVRAAETALGATAVRAEREPGQEG